MRLAVTSSLPAGRQREITGGFGTHDGELVLTGLTIISATYRHIMQRRPVIGPGLDQPWAMRGATSTGTSLMPRFHHGGVLSLIAA